MAAVNTYENSKFTNLSTAAGKSAVPTVDPTLTARCLVTSASKFPTLPTNTQSRFQSVSPNAQNWNEHITPNGAIFPYAYASVPFSATRDEVRVLIGDYDMRHGHDRFEGINNVFACFQSAKLKPTPRIRVAYPGCEQCKSSTGLFGAENCPSGYCTAATNPTCVVERSSSDIQCRVPENADKLYTDTNTGMDGLTPANYASATSIYMVQITKKQRFTIIMVLNLICSTTRG